MIQIIDLHKKFGQVQVLKELNLTIKESGIFAILGPNGSGKTTLIKSILGMVVPDKGDILIEGKSTKGLWDHRQKIDYLPQIANFPSNLSVTEVIEMIKNIRNQATRDKELINLFKLEPFLKKKLANLSGGTRQKVNIVLTFMFDDPILILDEPTTGLDPLSLIQLKALIQEAKAKGKTILITSHIMRFVEEISDEIVFLLDGKIYFKGSIKLLKDTYKQDDLEHAIASLLNEQYA